MELDRDMVLQDYFKEFILSGFVKNSDLVVEKVNDIVKSSFFETLKLKQMVRYLDLIPHLENGTAEYILRVGKKLYGKMAFCLVAYLNCDNISYIVNNVFSDVPYVQTVVGTTNQMNKIDPNIDEDLLYFVGKDALFEQIYNNNFKAVKDIIDSDLEKINYCCDSGDWGGWSPLTSAVYYDRPEIANLLIEKGASLEISSFIRCTPLHIAVYRKNISLIRTLLAHGADPNVMDRTGDTPLLCSQKCHPAVAQFLLWSGERI